jgi:hypothetical protein
MIPFIIDMMSSAREKWTIYQYTERIFLLIKFIIIYKRKYQSIFPFIFINFGESPWRQICVEEKETAERTLFFFNHTKGSWFACNLGSRPDKGKQPIYLAGMRALKRRLLNVLSSFISLCSWLHFLGEGCSPEKNKLFSSQICRERPSMIRFRKCSGV